MSDMYLRLIPKDPAYVPGGLTLPEAFARFCALVPKARDVHYSIYKTPTFVDMGGMLDRISCPNCKRDLELDWWSQAEHQAWQNQHQDLQVVVSCCNTEISLNDLIYEMPAGYARFVLQACNPAIDGLPKTEITKLERMLGCELKILWERY
jgi:hypothetical protein